MKRSSYIETGKMTRLVLTAMINDQSVLSTISPHWKRGLFDADDANLVGAWCVTYLEKFGKPPNDNIYLAFQRWAEKTNKTEDVVERIGKFVESLDIEEKADPDIVLDAAKDLFNEVRMKKAWQEAERLIDNGEIDQAYERIQIPQIDFEAEGYLEPYVDRDVWQLESTYKRTKPIVAYKGDLAEFFRGSLNKGEFYSFMGPDKTGKTTCLVDFCYRAIQGRQNVLFVDSGDGNEEDFMDRLRRRCSAQPVVEKALLIPKKWDKEGKVVRDSEKRGPLNHFKAIRQFEKISKGESRLRVKCYPNSTATIVQIDALIEEWAEDGWVVDVVIIDYADILAPPPGVRDSLEQIDENWKQMRRMSQKRNVLVMTATQSSAAAYRKGDRKALLGPQHFSGRKTKLAHVNGMIGINVCLEERKEQSSRWNWVVRRKQDHHRPDVINLAGNYDIENPCMISRW